MTLFWKNIKNFEKNRSISIRMYYRFVHNNVGIYEAVDKSCPRNDIRRHGKPDGSWLPKVGKKFPGAISFWSDYGLKRYLNSKLCEWHISVLTEKIFIIIAESIGFPLYSDKYQIIDFPDNFKISDKINWENFKAEHIDMETFISVRFLADGSNPTQMFKT